MVVAQDLHLDVLGAHDELLEEDRVVAERLLRLGARALERLGQLAGRAHDAHAAAAAAGRRLDDHRVADLVGEGARRLGVLHAARACPGTIGTPAASAILRAATLSPSASSTSGVGPTKTMPRVAALARERRRSRTGSRSRGGWRRRRGACASSTIRPRPGRPRPAPGPCRPGRPRPPCSGAGGRGPPPRRSRPCGTRARWRRGRRGWRSRRGWRREARLNGMMLMSLGTSTMIIEVAPSLN